MTPSGTLVLRLSVPAEGEVRSIAAEIAGRIAAYLGDDRSDAAAIAGALDGLAAQVAPNGGGGEIVFELRQIERDLVIEARCGSRSSEIRCPLPA